MYNYSMICTKCLIDKDISNFSLRDMKNGRRHRICKICHSLYRKGHYLANKDKYLIKARKWNRKQAEVLSKYLFEKLSHAKCMDCGENDILVLEFDHLENKKFNIALMYKNRYSLGALKKELEKCVVRCANCHRRKTAIKAGFWRYKMSLNKGV